MDFKRRPTTLGRIPFEKTHQELDRVRPINCYDLKDQCHVSLNLPTLAQTILPLLPSLQFPHVIILTLKLKSVMKIEGFIANNHISRVQTGGFPGRNLITVTCNMNFHHKVLFSSKKILSVKTPSYTFLRNILETQKNYGRFIHGDKIDMLSISQIYLVILLLCFKSSIIHTCESVMAPPRQKANVYIDC